MREVTLVEVGLRDGLQNESRILSTAEKKQLAERLIAAGVKELEITSFVHPRWIPQLSDAAELASSLPNRPDVRYRALVPNRKGLERALETPVDEFAVFLSASETHNRKNINKCIEETYPVLEEVVRKPSPMENGSAGMSPRSLAVPMKVRCPWPTQWRFVNGC